MNGLEAVVRFDRVSMRHGTGPEILSEVGFNLRPGGFCVLTGESRTGKTSFLRLLAMELRPSRGRIEVFGRDPDGIGAAERQALRRRMGIVFQDCRLIDALSVVENVALPLRIAGERGEVALPMAEDLLRWIGLGGQSRNRAASLTSEQRRRVAVARAVITRPRLLLADEPLAGLEEAMAERLLHLFEELNRNGTAVLIATRQQRLADRFPGAQLRLERGKLVLPPSGGPVRPRAQAPAAAESAQPQPQLQSQPNPQPDPPPDAFSPNPPSIQAAPELPREPVSESPPVASPGTPTNLAGTIGVPPSKSPLSRWRSV